VDNQSLDLFSLLKRAAGVVAATGVIGGAVVAIFAWWINANASHAVTAEHEPRIFELEKSSAAYQTYWADEIERRRLRIAQAEAFCERNEDACRGIE